MLVVMGQKGPGKTEVKFIEGSWKYVLVYKKTLVEKKTWWWNATVNSEVKEKRRC